MPSVDGYDGHAAPAARQVLTEQGAPPLCREERVGVLPAYEKVVAALHENGGHAQPREPVTHVHVV